MSLKADIQSIMIPISEKYKYKYFYGFSKDIQVPYIRYFLGNNSSIRLSNKKTSRNIWYQVDVFTFVPIDVESENTILTEIETALESKQLFTTDWMENFSENNSSQTTIFHYFIEVRK